MTGFGWEELLQEKSLMRVAVAVEQAAVRAATMLRREGIFSGNPCKKLNSDFFWI